MRIANLARALAAMGCLMSAVVYSEQAQAQDAPVCMQKMTQGKPGGDHLFTLAVRSDKAVALQARGFVRAACDRRKQRGKVRQQMCELAARSTPALEADFQRTYSVTPREICELSDPRA